MLQAAVLPARKQANFLMNPTTAPLPRVITRARPRADATVLESNGRRASWSLDEDTGSCVIALSQAAS